MSRRLVASLWRCEDPDCGCVQPMIAEECDEMIRTDAEVVWYGTFYPDPSPSEMEQAREELAEAARRHCLEPDGFDPDVYEREI